MTKKTRKAKPSSPYHPSRMSEEELVAGEELSGYKGEGRPQIRADCLNGPRPCPWVRCRYNLYLDVRTIRTPATIRLNFPGLAGPEEMDESCALDVADANPEGLLLQQIGDHLNVSTERTRQVEKAILEKLRNIAEPRLQELQDAYWPETPA